MYTLINHCELFSNIYKILIVKTEDQIYHKIDFKNNITLNSIYSIKIIHNISNKIS